MIRKVVAGTVLAVIGLGLTASLMTNHSYVTTPSMYPTIPPGSMIFVTHENGYHVGEVVEFRANGLVWAHRLVKINPDGSYVTKGDNPENAPDVFVPAVTQADVVGVVTHAPRWIGFPELILHHPGYGLSWLRAELGLQGKTLLVGIIGVLSLFYSLKSSGREPAKKSRRRRDEALTTTPADIDASVSDPDFGLAYPAGHERRRSGTGTTGSPGRHRRDRRQSHHARYVRASSS